MVKATGRRNFRVTTCADGIGSAAGSLGRALQAGATTRDDQVPSAETVELVIPAGRRE